MCHDRVVNLADRVWFAWWCLPRTGRGGNPPAWKALERDNGISGGTFSRLINDGQAWVSEETAGKLAKALGVRREWLLSGIGEPPVPPGPIPARPSAGTPPPSSSPIAAPATSEIRLRNDGVQLPSFAVSPGEGARMAAVMWARAKGFPETAVQAVLRMPPTNYGPEEWLAEIRLAAARQRLGTAVGQKD